MLWHSRRGVYGREYYGRLVVTHSKAELLQGTLDLLVLKALGLGPLHGYGIIERIRQMSDEMLTVEQGSLYPALYRIEQRGWVSSKWGTNETGHRAKFYTITKAGQTACYRRRDLGSAGSRYCEDTTGHVRSKQMMWLNILIARLRGL